MHTSAKLCFFVFLLLITHQSYADDTIVEIDSNNVKPVTQILDTTINIPKLDFSNIKLYDALTALARTYNLSLYVDPTVTETINFRLENVNLNDALLFIINEYDLSWQKTGSIIKIFKPVIPPKPPEKLNITYENNLLAVDVKNVDLEYFVTTLIELTGKNIIIENIQAGKISSKIQGLELDKALKVIFTSNNYTFKVIDKIIYIGKDQSGDSSPSLSKNLNVTCKKGLITLDVANNSIADVLTVLKNECGLDLFIQIKLEGTITASIKDKTAEETLTYLLLNSKYSFKEVDGIYFIGLRESEDMYDTKLIRLKHLIAETISSVIPVSYTKQLTIKVIKEHNGLVLTGPRTAIAKLESFINEVDVPMAQVLFEVLVVSYSTSDRAEFGITANNYGGDSGAIGQDYYPNIDLSGTGNNLNNNLRSLEKHLHISKLVTLDDNFFIRLHMMQEQGIATIKTHPKIATLNGHTASIKIGTTQYYLLESDTYAPSQQSNGLITTSKRFEQVNADISLEVTPFVNSSDELIVEVKPEFNTPGDKFNPDIPPTINKRSLNSTVKLTNGETIILGGLVENKSNTTISKFPILGSIPILGRLFQNRTKNDDKNELMIYITPFIYYGSEGAVNIDSLIIEK